MEAKCLTPNCGKKPRTRGICNTCYITANRIVQLGKTTWEELEANGLCLKKAHRKARAAFLIAFQSAIKPKQ